MIACPDFDRLADTAASGRPAALRALDEHAATCAACAAEAVLADDALAPDLALALGSLRDVTSPPAVVEAALRQTRAADRRADRRADRPARTAERRHAPAWRLGASVMLALATVAAALVVGDAPEPTPDLHAEAVTLQPEDVAEPAPIDEPAPEPALALAPRAETADVPVRPSRRPPPRRVPATRPAPAAEPVPPPSPLAHHALPGSDTEPEAADPEDADALAAAEGLQLALAVVGDAREHARLATADGLRRPYTTLTTVLLP